jgi:membrane-associated phospholipid phosphatase
MMREPKVLPVDTWVAGFNLFMLVVWLPLTPVEPAARWLVVIHTVALALPWLLARRPEPDSRFLSGLRTVYPLLWMCAFWREIDLHFRLQGGRAYDTLVLRFDPLVSGMHLHVALPHAVPLAWFSTLMQGIYFFYYLLLLGVPLGLLLVAPAARDVVLRLAVTYLVCFAVYTIMPTLGPLTDHAQMSGQTAGGWFFAVNRFLRETGDSLGTAFPSSHVAGAVTFAWLLCRYAPRVLGVAGWIIAVGVVGATVYTQNHYAIDALTGLLLAISLQSIVVPLLNRPAPEAAAAVTALPAPDIQVQAA